ncbi:FMN-binding negative transcriptional regulator [Aeromicrobium sp.]|uniref:FMN-binding negative transcriptional regulator n=1 Tax=Aeromicrobium sp. TaxID=1871063 RepID=UPI003D6A3A21
MLRNPFHQDDDPEIVRELIRDNPWAIIVSQKDGDLVASHYPVLLDEGSEGLAVVTHMGRPDDKNHALDSEVLLIIQGRHGYISPSWYVPGTTPAPTWNFSVVHAHGVPEILAPEENLQVLTRLVAHFEQYVDYPMYLDPELGRPLSRGTVGLRIPITRFQTQVKMSLDKDPVSRQNVIDHLRQPGPYSDPALADDMERARDRRGVR